MKSNFRTLALASLLVASTVGSAASPAAAVAQLAAWARHDMVIRLRNLPKRYSCDDLWNKFHEVLLSLGARPDMRILADQCKQTGYEGGFSPSVRLTFDTPQAVQGSRVGLSDFHAITAKVHLEPGQPQALDASDCELLRQMKNSWIAMLSDRVIDYRMACGLPAPLHGAAARFSLSVEALIPANSVRLATRAGPTPGTGRPALLTGAHLDP
jgi:hypothetical protein